jgi:uncharacterized protein (DUF486 family)
MRNGTIPAILLILAGVFLLLHQADLLSFDKTDLLTYGMIVLGILLFGKGLAHQTNRGILGGTFFMAFGAVLTLMKFEIIPRADMLGFSLFFLSLALASLVYFMFQPGDKANLVMTMVCGLVGGIGLLDFYDLYSGWYLLQDIMRFWPVLLILFGIQLIRKAHKRNSSYA